MKGVEGTERGLEGRREVLLVLLGDAEDAQVGGEVGASTGCSAPRGVDWLLCSSWRLPHSGQFFTTAALRGLDPTPI
jgi:hypothetical protein